jgi:hypothetical protein
MAQFYARSKDEERCRRSILGRRLTTLTGLTIDGRILQFSGKVQSVQSDSAIFPGYPLRVTMQHEQIPTRNFALQYGQLRGQSSRSRRFDS